MADTTGVIPSDAKPKERDIPEVRWGFRFVWVWLAIYITAGAFAVGSDKWKAAIAVMYIVTPFLIIGSATCWLLCVGSTGSWK